ncbi:hypothetical protein A0256_22505 [Mucilaginibacter sp. PAMC 26640]|nr:hypothetical protein A0256_22505 [Mucilaginibacter sp. PAMC 26640]
MSYKTLIIVISFIFSTYIAAAQKNAAGDSITIVVNDKFEKAGKIKRILLGTNYRKVWAQPITIPIIHLATKKGGLRITDIGGGNQTTSLQLKDPTGRQWVLRSVNKTTSRDQPAIYKHTIVEDLMLDAGSIGHPYSALCVPPMADALGLQHSNPSIVYVGDDPNLGKYHDEFANQVYLFEERGAPDGSKAIKTEDLQEKLEKNNDKKVDQKLVLRARLFDMVVNDWDRHGGQWRWEKNKIDDDVYEPIPRDRDKVFYNTGGIFFTVGSLIKPNLQPYTDHIRRVDLFNYNTVTFDLYFLNELNQKDWEEQIAYVQNALSNELITRSVKLMPANVYAVSGPGIIKTFKKRRDNMKKIGLSYYRFLAQLVEVPASNKDERFVITSKEDGDVQVVIKKIKKDSTEKTIYKRTFKRKKTTEIRLYGLDGNNTFEVKGSKPLAIKVRMIGGNDTDTYQIDTALKSRGKLYIYDRKDQPNNLPSRSDVHLKLSADTAINRYKHPENKYNTITPSGGLGYSTEDGLQLVAGLNYVKYGFQKEPYASLQQLKVNYTLGRHSFIFNYNGEFKQGIGKTDLLINAVLRGPNNTNNFFGLGNVGEFVNEGQKKFRYYRNRYDYAVADARLAHQYKNWQISGGIIAQYYTANAENNEDHFLSEYNQLHPELNLLSSKLYTGLIAGATLDTRNNKQFASKGLVWKTTLTGLTGINVADHSTASVLSTFTFFAPLKDSTIVFADRIGAGTMVGKGEFYQMMNLGGLSLRGYHTSRFIGNSMLYNNAEVRAKLFDFHNYLLPSAVGVILFDDTGRVWLKGEKSNTVHNTYGGGVFLTPYHAFLFEAVLGKSPEGTLVYFTLGFRY